jgi:hypothetical protein
MEALPAEKCCRYKSLTAPYAFNDLGAGRDSRILPECSGQVSHFNKRQ